VDIAVSGKFSDDCFDAAYAVLDQLREIIAQVGFEDVEANLDSLVFFPVIISDEFGIEKKSHRSYSAKERAEFVNVEIDVNEWSKANSRRRIDLMVNALKEAVSGTRLTRLSDEAKAIIIARLQTGFEESVR